MTLNQQDNAMKMSYQVAPEVLFSQIDGDVIILSAGDDAYLSLDPTGSRIWLLLQEPLSLDELVHILTDEYEVTDEDCRADVRDFLDDMVGRQLILVQQ